MRGLEEYENQVRHPFETIEALSDRHWQHGTAMRNPIEAPERNPGRGSSHDEH
jgi:hypothetical protein